VVLLKTQQRVLKSERPISNLPGKSLSFDMFVTVLMELVENWSDRLLMRLSRAPRRRELLWMSLMVARRLERH
jgi:hypothetical protein